MIAASALSAACDAPTSEVRTLAWVNRERCLDPCGLEPEQLVPVDRRGRLVGPKQAFRLRADVQPSLERWLTAAQERGFVVELSSGYRSYEEQEHVFMTTFEHGRAARPGHSEHQLGTAVDLRYDSSAAERWLELSAPEYGFLQSYPSGKEPVTGYPAEPWHFRFVGRPLASAVAASGLTLEELFRQHGSGVEPGDCQACPSPLSREPAMSR